MKKPITVWVRRKKRKWTIHDVNKLHQHQLDIIERYSAVYKLSSAMQVFWEVVFKSGELVAGQIRMLSEKTGERWSRHRYWKFRRVLERELRK